MGRDVERRRPRDEDDDDATKEPTPGGNSAYAAGMELAKRMGVNGRPPPGRAVSKRQDDAVDPFEEAFDTPFFKQGQTRRERTTKKTKHVISDTEYILTEETTEAEMFSFGDDIFKKDK